MKVVNLTISFGLVIILAGCAATKKIVIPSYSAPKEYQKISEITSGGESKEGTYLSLAIDPEVYGSEIETSLSPLLINSIQQSLTETNFINIYPIYNDAYVKLSMQVVSFDFNQTTNDINANLQVSYALKRGMTTYLAKTYKAETARYSPNSSQLPSKSAILFDLVKEVTEKFTSDITPLKSYQLREFKGLPKEVEYVLTYAKQGNFESAITDMEAYQGKANADFYYCLAVLYEAKGSKTKSINDFIKAQENYIRAMRLGGSADELIVKTKAKFDQFFKLFKLTEEQKQQNEKLSTELADMFGG
ncbi:hypothetical protein ACMZOO_09250 [Catenovulum sp. SX2]|uniref:hypothetical protein n=1 Tax=Catenovulum sp. SX2 TaxID=3398614 RepID=UPI003F83BF9B